MLKAIFYKEWIKLRWYMLLALIVTTAVAGYCLLRADRAIELRGAGHIWEVMVLKDAVFIDLLRFVPLLAGILAALVQFMPEMQRKCLKLTLHLPCLQQRMVFAMLAAGIAMLVACFAVNFAVMTAWLSAVLPAELVTNVLSAAAPWYLAGVAGYLLAAWVCLEPAWKRRVFNLAVAALIVRAYFLAPVPRAYNDFLPWLALYTLALSLLAWISVARFKAGCQD